MSVVFVAGSMRSGTTVLHRMVCSAVETSRFTHEVRWLCAQLDLCDRMQLPDDADTREHFGGPAGLDAFTADIVRRFIDHAAARAGNPARLVLKGPDLTFHVPRLAQWLHDAQFLISIREPKDIVASMRVVGMKQRKAGLQSPVARMADSAEALADLLNRFYARTLVALDSPELAKRILFVRYEDLVADPQKEADRVAAFAGITFDGFDPHTPWADEYGLDARLRDPRLASFVTEVSGQGLRDDRVGRWSRVLTPEDAAIVDDRCVVLRHQFGYVGSY